MRPRHLYVHVPFCTRRCSYCDFAIAVRSVVPVDEYLEALERELTLRFGTGQGGEWELDTLYFGGGTPSRLGGAGVARMLSLIRRHASLLPAVEVTLEANPEDVTEAAASSWRAAGVNRLSLGSQSFDERVLAWMHRTHDAAAIPRAVAAARSAGIEDISLDLIFAVPEMLERSWAADLDRALALAPTHLSLYGLTIEPRTPLGRWSARGEVVEAPEERYEAEFLEAHERLTTAGLEHYEVSNFARPGARARHNATYWEGRPYAGVGPSAHEFTGELRRWNVPSYAEWLRRLAAGVDPEEGRERLTEENRAAEAVYLGLRTDRGLPLRGAEEAVVAPWIRAGWGKVVGGRLRLTPSGWLRLDSLAADLTHFRSRS